MDRHALITEATAYWLLAMLAKQPDTAETRNIMNDVRAGLNYADLAEYAQSQDYIGLDRPFYVIWNPLNMRPITAQFGDEEAAIKTGSHMACKFGETFFVMKAVTKLIPQGNQATCEVRGLEPGVDEIQKI